ncbi:oxidase ustYa family protein [Aspergillus melleus]|uniref:oxidase ustYa family protein n=1 Tax=Aspergillus melleus TaxID=138277 RepID=UPI001E8E3E56|nr:uncharacterized protein LDX57_005000 [Aspergillus melleus]KAH8427286.1 hypothetical protein LDX57_005000 [Aspergillus melleus]
MNPFRTIIHPPTSQPKEPYRMPPKDEINEEDSLSIKASEDDDFLSGETLTRGPVSDPSSRYLPWLKYLLLGIAWTSSIVTAVLITSRKSRDCGGLARVYDTELGPIQSAIKVHKVRFSGNLEFDDNGTLVETYWDGQAPRYTGEPSDELDERWRSLIRADGVDLRGGEADTVRGTTYEKPGGWSLVGIDVFHQLHCLNLLRQGLRPDYYTKHDDEPAYTIHINHCLDYLRQAAMCNVDVTPIPVLWSEREDRPVPDFQVEHTCRDFWKVRDWAMERDAHRHGFKGEHEH